MKQQHRVAFITLGCKVNASETEGMRNLFEAAGYRPVLENDIADVYIINTCTVTNTGDKKSRQMIRRSRALNPDAVVAAVGCYAQVSFAEVASIPGVDLILGNNLKHLIVELVEKAAAERARETLGNDFGEGDDLGTGKGVRGAMISVMPLFEMTDFEVLPIAEYNGQTRAFLKVQDGCSRFCSYCIIPYARGPIRSRETGDVLGEAMQLAKKGFSEVVLTGIHLTSFRDENGKDGLISLVGALEEMPGIFRIRLGSLEPMFLTDTVLESLAACKKLCPHFHLSLQSGSASVLSRMNRRYGPEGFAAVVSSVRAHFPDASVTTDVMVGFPGETEEEFRDSLLFCESMEFAWMHVFPYSPRAGTPAAAWPGQVSKSIKSERAARMLHLAEKMRHRFMESFIGREAEVLFEHVLQDRPGWREGFTPNYLHVAVPDSGIVRGEIHKVLLTASVGDYMEGLLSKVASESVMV